MLWADQALVHKLVAASCRPMPDHKVMHAATKNGVKIGDAENGHGIDLCFLCLVVLDEKGP
jgi:hypothetical protein